jgi:hypothetical protein
MELENVNLDGGNVVASNLIYINFSIFEDCENWVQKQRLGVVLSVRCHDCPRKKFFILFTSHVDMDLFNTKKQIK